MSKVKCSNVKVVYFKEGFHKITRIEDVPLIATNVKILKFWSLLIDNTWRQYLVIIPFILLNLLQILHIFNDIETTGVHIAELCDIMLIFYVHLRAIHMTWKHSQFTEFLEYFKLLYVEMVEMNNFEIRVMLDECTQTAQRLTKYNLIIGSLSSFGFVVYPFFLHERVLVFSIYVPVIDKLQSPWYEIIFISHVLMTPCGLCICVPFTMLFVSCVLFAILMCRVLQYKLRSLVESANEAAHNEIIWCIEYQLKIIRFVDAINGLTSCLLMIEYILFVCIACGLLFSLIIVETYIQQLLVSFYIIMVFSQGFLMYYYANNLHAESLEVATAAYDCNWFDYEVETQKILMLVILRSQRSCSIRIANVYPMNLGLYLGLLKFTYSVYTLLRTLYG